LSIRVDTMTITTSSGPSFQSERATPGATAIGARGAAACVAEPGCGPKPGGCDDASCA
jgi:hypothetical protein